MLNLYSILFVSQCQQAAGPTKKTRLSIDDLRRALSNPADAKKLARMEELLFMQEDIKRARAQFDDNENIWRLPQLTLSLQLLLGQTISLKNSNSSW